MNAINFADKAGMSTALVSAQDKGIYLQNYSYCSKCYLLSYK